MRGIRSTIIFLYDRLSLVAPAILIARLFTLWMPQLRCGDKIPKIQKTVEELKKKKKKREKKKTFLRLIYFKPPGFKRLKITQ